MPPFDDRRAPPSALPTGGVHTLWQRVRGDYTLGVLVLGVVVAVVWLLPFALYRAWQGNWLAMANDLVLSALLSGAAGYAWRSGDTRRAGWVVGLAIVGGIWVIGWAARFAALFWIYPGVLMLFFLVPPAAAIVLGLAAIAGAAALSWGELGGHEGLLFFIFTASLTALLGYVVAQQAQQHIRGWRTLSLLDPLTGVGNRRLLELELAQAGGALGTLVVVDLDHFKAINDRLGHDEGDAVLRRFADVTRGVLRKSDRLYRLGGEEFVLWLPQGEPQAVQALLQRLRARVAEDVQADQQPVTFSAGVAVHAVGEPWQACLARADAALYDAKRTGRDRAAWAPPGPAMVARS